MVALLDHLGLERAALWGYSSRVAVGLKVAQEHPNRIGATGRQWRRQQHDT